jgi:ankyrin repeat protein
VELFFFQTHSSILLYLLSQPRVKINIQDSQKRTPLHHAIMYDRVENAKYLIEHKAKLDVSSFGDIYSYRIQRRKLANRSILCFESGGY